MKVTKILVKNFRLLKDIHVNLEDDHSIILGKNNSGKTSLLLILDRFIGSNASKPSFTFDDFNIDLKDDLKSRIEDSGRDSEEFLSYGISLKLYIEYGELDDLSNIGNKVIMDLDPDNNVVILAFEYYLSKDRFLDLKRDYQEQQDKKKDKAKDLFTFLKDQHSSYFQVSKKSVLENDKIFTDLIKEKIHIDKIISFKSIIANRNVSNKNSNQSLSSLSSRVYNNMEAIKDNLDIIDRFKDALSNTDQKLNEVYKTMFQAVIDDVKKFGGMSQDDSIIQIVSSLQNKELLQENTTVMYDLKSGGHLLPENYNGLGYMNLISMIFEIKILLHEFQREKEEKPSDINLLFIEEPEVHTHPQMQYVFIKNIKDLLENRQQRRDGVTWSLQTILSTHFAHIVSESEFEKIKYFKREEHGIISKNLKDLKNKESDQSYKFLKQYLTLHRAELFFADKAIFIEGDTERILLPAIMKKLDKEFLAEELRLLPLLSQNISIIEVGAYSHIFEKFIDFIGIKSLIITDIDSVNEEREKCQVSDGKKTSNASLKFFYGKEKTLTEFIALSWKERIMKKDPASSDWVSDADGYLMCTYQTKETADTVDYHARSFEDAFFHINKSFIAEHTFDPQDKFIGNQKFPSLTQNTMKQFAKSEIKAWEMAKGVGSKPSFAIEVLLNSDKDFTNWNIPAYIIEGLRWLQED